MTTKKYITYIHKDTSLDTVGALTAKNLSVVKEFVNNEEELINYKGDTDKTNKERIFKQYNEQEKKDNQGKSAANLKLKFNTKLLIPKDKFNSQVAYTISNQVVDSPTFKGFLAKQLNDLFADKNYKQEYISTHDQFGISKNIHYFITVWVWSRVLNEFIDITAFVKECNTTVGKQGGNFQISLPPLIANYKPSKDNKGYTYQNIEINKLSINYFQGQALASEYEAESSFFKLDEKNNLKRNQFYFHDLLQTNDLVYIRFQYLQNEEKRKKQQFKGRKVSKEDIPGNIYDMIGLIDTNGISFSPPSSDMDIQISGRDLMKTLLDDGAYFYPTEFADGSFIYSQNNDNRNVNRVFGEIRELAVYVNRSIEDSIKFIINRLSTTGFVPDNIFEAYKERRNKRLIKQEANEGAGDLGTELMAGVWQIIDLLIDDNIRKRKVVDDSISAQSGSLINFVQKICEEPFVEFFGDTYGDKYHFIARQPPFNQEAIKSMILGYNNTEVKGSSVSDKPAPIFIEEHDLIQEKLSFDDNEVYTWYKLNPQGIFFGNSEEVSMAFLPAFYLTEYAEIWGSRPLDITTNYINFQPYTGNRKKEEDNSVFAQGLRDLKYLIDINAYVPFTRKGQIVINLDRRIKRGTFIKYVPTNEIFYVDSVSHNFSIGDTVDGTTTLQLQRGMIEDFIFGKNVNVWDEKQGNFKKEKVSYFNIVNTEIEQKFLQDNEFNSKKILKNWGVNKPIFNFFLRKEQFAYV